VRWLIVAEGVNDIGAARGAEGSSAVARQLEEAYRTIVRRAHAKGLRVYGATILPFGGSFYASPEHEAARQAVNAWIRTAGVFDAVIDLDAALRDPGDPSRLLPAADGGDHLHPNERGYELIAAAVELALFM
jgi:lysophospholipase L1-like esterase